MTFQLIYSSVSAIPMQGEDLRTLLEHAQRGNAARAITGALVYVDGHFLQVLEGERGPVQALMERIGTDVRHEDVTVLQAQEVAGRQFPRWDMAFVSATPLQVAEWIGFRSVVRLPDVFDDLRHDRRKAEQVTQRILAVLAGEAVPQADGG